MSGFFELEVGKERLNEMRREAQRHRLLTEAIRGARTKKGLNDRTFSHRRGLFLLPRAVTHEREESLPS
jgi:hypothetical protein